MKLLPSHFSLFTFLYIFIFASCGSKSEAPNENIDEELNEIVESREYKENGLNKIRAVSDTINSGHGYLVILSVSPDESQPRVPNDNFGTYCDNRATVKVVRTNAQSAEQDLTNTQSSVPSSQFFKSSFIDYLDETLRTYAVLDALTFVGAEANRFTVEASISVPHSDEQALITITIGLDGSVSMQRSTVDNDAFPEEDIED